MVWIIFVYGLLVYKLLGVNAEREFVRGWLTGLGLDNLNSFRDVLKEALKVLIIVALVEPFLVPRQWWFQQHVDVRPASRALLLAAFSLAACGRRRVFVVRHRSPPRDHLAACCPGCC